MRMRWRPLRGEKVKDMNNKTFTVLEVQKDMVKCLSEAGFTTMIAKSSLNLPIIDTANYERL